MTGHHQLDGPEIEARRFGRFGVRFGLSAPFGTLSKIGDINEAGARLGDQIEHGERGLAPGVVNMRGTCLNKTVDVPRIIRQTAKEVEARYVKGGALLPERYFDGIW